MLIRKADKKDVNIIVDLNKKMFRNEHENKFDTTLDVQWSEKAGKDSYNKFVSSDDGVIFVAEENKRIVGYLFGCVSKPAAYRIKIALAALNELFVDSEFRSKGIGKELVKTFEKWCRENGIKRISVTVSARNKNGVKFYRNNGFDDYDLVMERDL